MTGQPTSNNPDDLGRQISRDEDLRPDGDGRPPRPATEPEGSKSAGEQAKTATDPVTGEPNS